MALALQLVLVLVPRLLVVLLLDAGAAGGD